MVRAFTLSAALLAGAALFTAVSPTLAADTAVKAPAASVREPEAGHRETAVFAGGCFWGVQGVFAHVKGVVSATSGYAGGKAATANYETVSTGTTGHAEAVRVVFDPAQLNYADLLRIYFSVVTDPTELNRQGPDDGPQYRSALFPQSPSQADVARAYLKQLTGAHVFGRRIVTMVETGGGFFPAEGYHQDFMARNPNYPYIVVNDRPKVEALQRIFAQSYRG